MKRLLLSLGKTSPLQADLGLLVVRLWFGLTMAFGHGLGKLTNLDKFIAVVERQGVFTPEVMGTLAALSEFAGGLFLALGLLTRASAGTLAVTMAVAAFYIHGDDPFGKQELALCYGAAALAIMVAGPGRLALDRLLFVSRSESAPPSPPAA